jgi:hypothetical protein
MDINVILTHAYAVNFERAEQSELQYRAHVESRLQNGSAQLFDHKGEYALLLVSDFEDQIYASVTFTEYFPQIFEEGRIIELMLSESIIFSSHSFNFIDVLVEKYDFALRGSYTTYSGNLIEIIDQNASLLDDKFRIDFDYNAISADVNDCIIKSMWNGEQDRSLQRSLMDLNSQGIDVSIAFARNEGGIRGFSICLVDSQRRVIKQEFQYTQLEFRGIGLGKRLKIANYAFIQNISKNREGYIVWMETENTNDAANKINNHIGLHALTYRYVSEKEM